MAYISAGEFEKLISQSDKSWRKRAQEDEERVRRMQAQQAKRQQVQQRLKKSEESLKRTQAGIFSPANIISDIVNPSNYVPLVKGAGRFLADNAITFGEQLAAKDIAKERAGKGTFIGSKTLSPLLKQYQQDLKKGVITQQQYDNVAAKIEQVGRRTDKAVKSTEKDTGVKIDQSTGAYATLGLAADASSVDIAKLLAKGGTAAARKIYTAISGKATRGETLSKTEQELLKKASDVIDKKADGPVNDVEQLSRIAKNSLQNNKSGIKPNGVQRAGQFIDNANARPVEYRRLEDGSISIVDGRHTLEYARQNGITDFPMRDVTEQYTAKSATADQLSQTLIDASKKATTKYDRSRLGKAAQKVKETLNVTHELAKIDNAARAKLGTLAREDSLEQAYDKVINYRQAADDVKFEKMSTGNSVTEVMQKHANDVDEFNNYRNALAELFARSKKVKFRQGLSNADLKDIVSTYEKANPGARQDIYTLNEAINKARKFAADNGAITDELQAKLGQSRLYTPVKVAAADVPKAKVGGKAVVRGEQQFAKELSGPTDQPILTQFDPVLTYIDNAYKNAAEARLSQLLLKRQKEGLIKDAVIRSEPGAKADKRILRDYSKATLKAANRVQKKVKITAKQARMLQSEINKFSKRGVEVATSKSRSAPRTDNPVAFIKQMVEKDPAELMRIKKKIANREPKLAQKFDEIIAAQDELATLKSQARGYRQAASEIVDDPTTGESFIKGIDEFGNTFSMQLPPDLMRVLRGTDINPSNGFMKAALNVQRTFQTFWTGFINPIFQTITSPIYDTAANVNALVDNPKALFESIKPDSLWTALRGFKSTDAFQQSLRSVGAAPQGGSLMPQEVAKTAESIISRRNLKSRTGYLVKNPKELLHVVDQFGGKLGNATRTRLARGYYKQALKNGMTETQALEEAAFAYNNLAPNFNRVNALARDGNAFIPYFTASVAGNRSMWQPILRNPGRAAAIYGGITATFVGATASNLASERGQEYYKQMRESGKQYVLDNNYIIVLPTAQYDEKTGQWSGIIKMPIAPEFRYINKLAHNLTQQATTSESDLNPAVVAGAIFNTMTGGLPDSASQGPGVVSTAQILAGGDPRSSVIEPTPLTDPYTASLPKEEQQYPWTSNPAKFFSDVTGSKISPIQADAIIGQFGAVGQSITGNSPVDQVKNKFTGSYTDSLKSQVYKKSDDYRSLSSKMKNAGGGVDNARKIAVNFNKKVDRLIEQVQSSSLPKDEKEKIISGLRTRKASTKTSSLKNRLD